MEEERLPLEELRCWTNLGEAVRLEKLASIKMLRKVKNGRIQNQKFEYEGSEQCAQENKTIY